MSTTSMINLEMIGAEQVIKALDYRSAHGVPLLTAMVSLSWIPTSSLVVFWNSLVKWDVVRFPDYLGPKQCFSMLPERLVIDRQLIPLKSEDNVLSVAFCDPSDIDLIDDVKLFSGYLIKPFLIDYSDWIRGVESLTGDKYFVDSRALAATSLKSEQIPVLLRDMYQILKLEKKLRDNYDQKTYHVSVNRRTINLSKEKKSRPNADIFSGEVAVSEFVGRSVVAEEPSVIVNVRALEQAFNASQAVVDVDALFDRGDVLGLGEDDFHVDIEVEETNEDPPMVLQVIDTSQFPYQSNIAYEVRNTLLHKKNIKDFEVALASKLKEKFERVLIAESEGKNVKLSVFADDVGSVKFREDTALLGPSILPLRSSLGEDNGKCRICDGRPYLEHALKELKVDFPVTPFLLFAFGIDGKNLIYVMLSAADLLSDINYVGTVVEECRASLKQYLEHGKYRYRWYVVN